MPGTGEHLGHLVPQPGVRGQAMYEQEGPSVARPAPDVEEHGVGDADPGAGGSHAPNGSGWTLLSAPGPRTRYTPPVDERHTRAVWREWMPVGMIPGMTAKVTLSFSDDTIADARRWAQRDGVSLSAWIDQAARERTLRE